MYVNLEEARDMLWSRRRNLMLRREVQKYLGELPDFLKKGPRAVLARQVATPNLDFHVFSRHAVKIGLKAACPDYAGDKFCSKNPDKLALAKMTFFHGKGRNRGDKTSHQRIVDFSRWDGRPLKDVQTLWGEGLIDFHHRLLQSRFPEVEISDNTAWLKRMGGKPALFWPRLLALFLCDGILFENFHTAGQETAFTRNIILPALESIRARFGLSPLIVPLVPLEKEQDSRWSWYPSDFRALAEQALETAGRSYETGHQPATKPIRGGAYA
jgi:hypothetical protein